MKERSAGVLPARVMVHGPDAREPDADLSGAAVLANLKAERLRAAQCPPEAGRPVARGCSCHVFAPLRIYVRRRRTFVVVVTIGVGMAHDSANWHIVA